MKKVLLGVKTRLINFLYNEDRSVASLAGAPPQETISSEIGRHEGNPIDEEALTSWMPSRRTTSRMRCFMPTSSTPRTTGKSSNDDGLGPRLN